MYSLIKKGIVPFFLFIVSFPLFGEKDIKMLSWNIESGGNSPVVIAKQLSDYRDYDLISLQEVDDESVSIYHEALGDNYAVVVSESGSRFNDHLLVFYKIEVLENTGAFELHQYKNIVLVEEPGRSGLRSPLVLNLTHLPTGSDFICITVHFTRGDAAHRILQAFTLREWILDQTVPVVALGDFNFDYQFGGETGGNDSYNVFTFEKKMRWIRPEVLIDTNYSERNGRETYPDSILDFIFTSTLPESWTLYSTIITRPDDFPDDETTSDHRPVSGELRFSKAQPAP